MPSSFSWLDFAESDRDRAMQVIDLFREKTTVDELGFAPIRDAFADRFFPGTSTIQTRARYFLLVPWVVQGYDHRKLSAQERASKIRAKEVKLIDALIAGSTDHAGIIGLEAKHALQRMPSSVYWRGLYLWGIRLFSGSLDQYCRKLSRDAAGSQVVVTDDKEPLGETSHAWHPSLPERPEDTFRESNLELSLSEAEFLRDRIADSQPGSLLAHLVTGDTTEFFADAVWDDAIRKLIGPSLRKDIEHARLFSLCAWGASLTYSRCVNMLKFPKVPPPEQLSSALAEWQDQLKTNAAVLEDWNCTEFWALVSPAIRPVSRPTQTYVKHWIDVSLRAAHGEAVWEDENVRIEMTKREVQLKGRRARLVPENILARDLWQGDALPAPMDYRWRTSRTIINDILNGLAQVERSDHSDA